MIRDDATDCHDNRGYGIRNEEDERFLELAGTPGFVMTNTFFKTNDKYHILKRKDKVATSVY